MACSTAKLVVACHLDPLSSKRIARIELNFPDHQSGQYEERGFVATVRPPDLRGTTRISFLF